MNKGLRVASIISLTLIKINTKNIGESNLDKLPHFPV